MKKSESIAEISKALSAFQDEVIQPQKSAANPFFKSKYTPFDDIVKTVNTFAPKHGLSFTQWALTDDNKTGVATMIMHTSGEWIEFPPLFLPADKNTAQGAGSVVTYAKRYSLAAVFGIASDEDDDGNAASGAEKQNKKQPSGNTSKGISESQIKKINAICGSIAKITDQEQSDVYDAIKAKIQVDSFKNTTSMIGSKAIETLEAWEKHYKEKLGDEDVK